MKLSGGDRMADLEDTINQAISDFDDIEKALEEKGVNVPYNTDTSEYGNLVRSISGSGTVVDQNYNANSANAQSGYAVAEALRINREIIEGYNREIDTYKDAGKIYIIDREIKGTTSIGFDKYFLVVLGSGQQGFISAVPEAKYTQYKFTLDSIYKRCYMVSFNEDLGQKVENWTEWESVTFGSSGGAVDAYTKAETDNLLENKVDKDKNGNFNLACLAHAENYEVLLIGDSSNPTQNGVSFYSKEQMNTKIGNIETALDSIIAIQNELIGGGTV